ncbi:MAG: epoxyqueuosine reductase QueH [Candidatus Muiribacteriota bacterium]
MSLINTSEYRGEIFEIKEKILIHACCAVCFENFYDFFEKSIDNTVFWFNPNVQGVKEYRKRKEALKRLVNKKKIKYIENNNYDLKKFMSKIECSDNGRCFECYKWRLEETAKVAKENGFTSFTTTLLCSPMQKHEIILKLGEKIAADYGLKFFYFDLRDCYDSKILRKTGLYTQNYCGCIFSEEERYLG